MDYRSTMQFITMGVILIFGLCIYFMAEYGKRTRPKDNSKDQKDL